MTPVSIRHVAPNCLSTHISTLTLLINDVIKEGGLVCVCVGVFVCVLGWGGVWGEGCYSVSACVPCM